MSVVLPSRVLPSTGTAPKTMYYGVYQASVVNMNDPQNKGRIQMKVPQILGTATSNWADPLGLAVVNIPTAGTLVYAAFIGGDVNHPVYWTVNSSITVTNLTTSGITLSQVATPSTPASGVKLWSDTNGKFNFKGTNGLAEFAQNIIVDGTFKAASTSEFDDTITIKNSSVSSTISVDSTDGHPILSEGLRLSQISAPATPASGVRIWSDTNGKLNFKGTNGSAEFAQALILDSSVNFTSISSPATPGSGLVMWADSDIALRYRGPDGSAQAMGHRTVMFTGAQTVSSATMTTITDGTNNFSATVSAGKYRFRARIIYQASGTSGAPNFEFTTPAFSSGGATFTLQYNGIASGFGRYDNTSTLSSPWTSVGNSVVGTSLFVIVDMEGTALFNVGGTISARCTTNSGSNFVIQTGSFFITEPF